MIADLLLALASIAVLVSPLILEAGFNYEHRRSLDSRARTWKDEFRDELPS